MRIGLIGLGGMGRGLAKNMAAKLMLEALKTEEELQGAYAAKYRAIIALASAIMATLL